MYLTVAPAEIQTDDFIIEITANGHTWGPGGIMDEWQAENVYISGEERYQLPGPSQRAPRDHVRVMFTNSYTDIPVGGSVIVGRN
jgi:hypothetical protein